MKKWTLSIVCLVALAGAMSCTTEQTNTEKEPQTTEEATPDTRSEQDVQKTIAAIDKMRGDIESRAVEPVEISSSDLRDKIKQKWSKLHVYVENDVVVKIKTYPYPEISKRTEEFYADADGLRLVAIEDDGDTAKGKAKSEIDKMYYFENGELIEESSKKSESEYSIRKSDAEELLSEFEEYVDIFRSSAG